MKDAEFIQTVTNINVIVKTIGETKLMMLQVNGSSQNTLPGLPFLRLRKDSSSEKEGLIEFDLLMSPSDELFIKGNMDWEIKTVYRMEELPPNPQAIKICAAENADIAMIIH